MDHDSLRADARAARAQHELRETVSLIRCELADADDQLRSLELTRAQQTELWRDALESVALRRRALEAALEVIDGTEPVELNHFRTKEPARA